MIWSIRRTLLRAGYVYKIYHLKCLGIVIVTIVESIFMVNIIFYLRIEKITPLKEIVKENSHYAKGQSLCLI